jgi:hypothetical protein
MVGSTEGGSPAAAAQFFDTAFLIGLGVSLLLSAGAFIVMRLYMRRIFRESQQAASLSETATAVEAGDRGRLQPEMRPPLEIQAEGPGRPTRLPAARSPTFRHADAAFRHAARVYLVAGSIHAAISVSLLFLSGILSTPSTPSRLTILVCYASVFWSWSIITVVTLALFWGPERPFRRLLVLGYVAVPPALGLLLLISGAPALPFADVGLMQKEAADLVLSFASAVTGQPVPAGALTFSPLTQPTVFWCVSRAPLAFLFLFFNRPVRGTVGPLFINVALMMVLSMLVIGDLLLYTSPGLWLVSHIKGILRDSTPAALIAISLILSAVVAWLGLVWTARRYRRRQTSDQTFLFDALWLSASLYLCGILMDDHHRFRFLLGLLPFALYKMTVGYGLKRLAARAESLPKAQLLFLRVFGSSSRSEKLFDLVAARWRYAGGIRVLSATDVARGRFEPDEFLDFVSGRLADAYISTQTDLDRRLAGIDPRTDPDGRYRVDEFFCRADTWQPTVTRLMKQSDLVAMDLRAFRSERKGSIFELGALIDEVPLHRVALLIDRTTDEPLLRRTLADLWRTMNPQSPNASSGIGHVRIIDLTSGYPAAARRLMQLGDEAVTRAGG